MNGDEPRPQGLDLVHEEGRSLRVSFRDQELVRYVYVPWDVQLESPRPYFHPLHTLGGDLVSLYRPHDHVWHKGIAWSLPNVGPANFWGGTTYTRGRGYEQLANDGSMQHRGFDQIEAGDELVRVAHRLDWVTEQGQTWFAENRSFAVGVDQDADCWSLSFATRFVNVSDEEIVIGSPTTQGRDNAGYGGWFWRGPRSFSGGTVHIPGRDGDDDLMGVRSPWMAFRGRHDSHGRTSTLVFVDPPDNPGHPTQWFVRSEMYACLCPAPFFSEEVPLAPGESFALHYSVVIADGDRVADADKLAEVALAAATALPREPATGGTAG
jgi:hypothetical protein